MARAARLVRDGRRRGSSRLHCGLRRGTRELATAYLEHLYSPEGQEIIARHFYRPINEQVAAEYAQRFAKINLVTIRDFGGWAAAQKKHFADGGVFDQIYSTQ